MQWLKEIFIMPLFPHLYAIPVTIILGMAMGYYLRGVLEEGDEGEKRYPPKPKV